MRAKAYVKTSFRLGRGRGIILHLKINRLFKSSCKDKSSAADPGCLSQIPEPIFFHPDPFRIPYPGLTRTWILDLGLTEIPDPGWIRTKKFTVSIFLSPNTKINFSKIRSGLCFPDPGPWLFSIPDPDPGSRDEKKSTGSRI